MLVSRQILRVSQPASRPVILQGPVLELQSGQVELLQCSAEGRPAPEISWLDGQSSKPVKLTIVYYLLTCRVRVLAAGRTGQQRDQAG